MIENHLDHLLDQTPPFRWLVKEYVNKSDHPMAGLNRLKSEPVLQYFNGIDWVTVKTVSEIVE